MQKKRTTMWFFYKMKNALKSETARGHFRNCDPLFLFFIAFFILTKPRYLSISDLEKCLEIKKYFEKKSVQNQFRHQY
jgi:hypothetical protein